MQPSMDRFQSQQGVNQAASMLPGFSGLGLASTNSEAIKKRSKEAPEPTVGRRITMQLDGNAATEDLMMQIDQEEKKAEERASGIRRTNTTAGQAMSMRPKTLGAKDMLGLQGLPKAK